MKRSGKRNPTEQIQPEALGELIKLGVRRSRMNGMSGRAPLRIQMDLPPLLEGHSKLLRVQQVLSAAGFRAWIAGGAVRDALLGRTPHDFDLVTDASVEEIAKLFAKSVLVGAQFGVVKVIFEDEEFEIAQFRQEGDYRDGRHPSLVAPGTPEQDAARRDLTVNALFYDPLARELHDFVGGLEDLKNKTLRAVGDARVRFREDHLRILRAVRFLAQLPFRLDPELERAVHTEVLLLGDVSRERVREELMKMNSARGWTRVAGLLVESGVASVLFPGIELDSSAARELTAPRAIKPWCEWGRWMLASGQEGPAALKALASLRLSRQEEKETAQFLAWYADAELWNLSLGELIDKALEPAAREGFENFRDEHGLPTERAKEVALKLDHWPERPEPWVQARDFPDLKGPALGQALREAYWRQLSGEDSSREAALARKR